MHLHIVFSCTEGDPRFRKADVGGGMVLQRQTRKVTILECSTRVMERLQIGDCGKHAGSRGTCSDNLPGAFWHQTLKHCTQGKTDQGLRPNTNQLFGNLNCFQNDNVKDSPPR